MLTSIPPLTLTDLSSHCTHIVCRHAHQAEHLGVRPLAFRPGTRSFGLHPPTPLFALNDLERGNARHWGMVGGLWGGGGPGAGGAPPKTLRLAFGRVRGVPSLEPKITRLALWEGLEGGYPPPPNKLASHPSRHTPNFPIKLVRNIDVNGLPDEQLVELIEERVKRLMLACCLWCSRCDGKRSLLLH